MFFSFTEIFIKEVKEMHLYLLLYSHILYFLIVSLLETLLKPLTILFSFNKSFHEVGRNNVFLSSFKSPYSFLLPFSIYSRLMKTLDNVFFFMTVFMK